MLWRALHWRRPRPTPLTSQSFSLPYHYYKPPPARSSTLIPPPYLQAAALAALLVEQVQQLRALLLQRLHLLLRCLPRSSQRPRVRLQSLPLRLLVLESEQHKAMPAGPVLLRLLLI